MAQYMDDLQKKWHAIAVIFFLDMYFCVCVCAACKGIQIQIQTLFMHILILFIYIITIINSNSGQKVYFFSLLQCASFLQHLISCNMTPNVATANKMIYDQGEAHMQIINNQLLFPDIEIETEEKRFTTFT